MLFRLIFWNQHIVLPILNLSWHFDQVLTSVFDNVLFEHGGLSLGLPLTESLCQSLSVSVFWGKLTILYVYREHYQDKKYPDVRARVCQRPSSNSSELNYHATNAPRERR